MGALLIPPQRPTRGRSGSRRRGSGSCPGDLVDYTPTEPLLVVEVDADVCFEHERWRHPTGFRRVRGDLQPADLSRRAVQWPVSLMAKSATAVDLAAVRG